MHDFTWRGESADQHGVIVTEQVQYHHPPLRDENITIPGRSGSYRLLGHGDVYDEVTYSPSCAIRPGVPPSSVWRWLQGSGPLTFSSMPGWKFEGRIASDYSASESAQGHPDGYILFTPVFLVQPWRFREHEDTIGIPTSERLYNPGEMDAEPDIILTCSPGAVIRITMTAKGDSGAQIQRTLTVTAPDGGSRQSVTVNTEWDVALSSSGRCATDGEFPRIPPGEYTLTATAESGTLDSTLVRPRYRYL